jgi:hypothetical protein
MFTSFGQAVSFLQPIHFVLALLWREEDIIQLGRLINKQTYTETDYLIQM